MIENLGGRVDAHHHVWDLVVRDQPWTASLPALRRSFGFDDLRPSLVRNGIGSTIVVQTVADPTETPELLALAASESLVVGVVGWVDLAAGDVADRLAGLRARPGGAKLVGIRHQAQDEADPRWLAREDVRAGLRAVGEAGLAYELLVRPPQLGAAVDAARALPDVRFVLDHAGKPPIAAGTRDGWLEPLRKLGALDNTAVKLSGLITEAGDGATAGRLRPYGDAVLDAFGPARTMFGSDWPVCLLRASYDEVFTLALELTDHLDAGERDAVFGGSAVVWYRLPAR